MSSCWLADPDERPSFDKLSSEMDLLLLDPETNVLLEFITEGKSAW